MPSEQVVAPQHLLAAHDLLDILHALDRRFGGQFRALARGKRLEPFVIAGQYFTQSLGLGIGVDLRLQLAQPLLLRHGQRDEALVLAQQLLLIGRRQRGNLPPPRIQVVRSPNRRQTDNDHKKGTDPFF